MSIRYARENDREKRERESERKRGREKEREGERELWKLRYSVRDPSTTHSRVNLQEDIQDDKNQVYHHGNVNDL